MKPLGPKDPRQLGRNQLIAVIGQGGMGRVMLGRAPTGRLVAVKQIHRHLAGDTEFRARFDREVQASRRVAGAYTAAVVDSDTGSESPWLATEYIPGPALKTVVDECGPFTLGGLRLLATGLASALVEIHRAGLVHRDLKPANVLLAADGPRVIDFGIARALEADQQLTATGSVIGSPAFMSPEQAEGRSLTPAADVFSVGAILAMAARGSSPFSGTSTPQILYNVMHSEPDTTGVPPDMRALVEACLAKDPAQRPTAEQLLEAAGRISAEPAWPPAVRERIAEHQADTDWWVEKATREIRHREQLARVRGRRRRVIRAAAAAAACLLVVAGTAAAAQDLARQSGQAVPMGDPSLALSAEEWRLLDRCALLEEPVLGVLGTLEDKAPDNPELCQTAVTDDEGGEIWLSLYFDWPWGESAALPTGDTVAWMPIFKSGQENGCYRSVIAQSGAPVVITVDGQLVSGDKSCSGMAQRALVEIVKRLTVNPPLRKLPAESVFRIDACGVIEPQLARTTAGDPGQRTSRDPHECWVNGSDYIIEFDLLESSRPDRGNRTPVQVDDATVYMADREEKYGSCELEYMVRLLEGLKAEVVKVNVIKRDRGPGACEGGKQIMASVIPKISK
ncbi:serine/threonine protein kinase [Nocardia otitidiscaviarum]|uniref:serine/threonine-protein kinase n=1 Tax=Nocardia otitidiscaviarum TaxID=1823 RepID=UPI0018954D0A|nr:serine/threonine-protein kinase [Nocardia otitidiscaviarum]MBF6133811.1 serine/threonine protein kinase [Nocardia otitidiscaviarum]